MAPDRVPIPHAWLGARRRLVVRFPLFLTAFMAACSGSKTVLTPATSPTPTATPRIVATPSAAAIVMLGSGVPDTRSQVVAETWLRPMSSSDPEQRILTSAIVSWRFDRRADGSMRGTGSVRDFRVSASFTAPKAVPKAAPKGNPQGELKGVVSDSLISPVTLDIVLDSMTARVVTRPPLVNECDRLEAAASHHARAAAIRVPERLQEGTVWRDSTVTLACRSGVPVTVYTTSTLRVLAIESGTIRVTRETVFQFRGSGGVAFQRMTVVGTGTGRAQILLRRPEGTLDRLSESSTSRLTLTVTSNGGAPREQRMEQEVTLRVEPMAWPR